MKILFAADMSFNFLESYPGDEAVEKAMSQVVPYFADADASIVNLENILGEKTDYEPIPKCGPNLISSDEFVKYIEVLNPSVVGMANNHTGDFGEGAVFHTMDVLQSKGYPWIGAGKNLEEAYKPYLIDDGNMRVGIIAVCENEFGGAKMDKAGSAGYRLGMLTAEIKRLKEAGYMSIIYFHGGNEYYPFPSPGKKELYRHFIDLGASAVVAMHTHCPQGYEMYEGKPIIYSMGNFFFPAKGGLGRLRTWFYGYMVQLEFAQGEISVTTIPYHFDETGICLLQGEELNAFWRYLDYISGVIADDVLLREYFEAWCAYQGEEFSGYIRFEKSYFKDHSSCVACTRNIFYCEAHGELMKELLNLCYENRLDEAGGKIEKIKQLQKLEL